MRKLGIAVARSTAEKYRLRHRTPPSPAWLAFLKTHGTDLVSIDFFTMPTVNFKILFAVSVLPRERWRGLHFNVAEHPTAQWTVQKLIEAFPWETAPTYLLRDRNAMYGDRFQRRVTRLGIDHVLAAPRSPWQHAYAERVIGRIRRECLDHVMGFSEGHLQTVRSQG